MQETESNTKKRCKACNQRFGPETDLADIVRHYLAQHPRSDRLSDALNSMSVSVDCQTCGETFTTPVNYGKNGRIGADAHCPDCVLEDEYRTLFAQSLSAAELIEQRCNANCADANS